MMFPSYTKSDAPADSLPLIERSLATYGFLPNLHAVLAAAPATYKAYLDTFELLEKHSTLSPLEQQIVFQTANFHNRCHYCLPGHSMLMTLQKMPDAIIEALREGEPLADVKLEALRLYTQRLLEHQGHLSQAEIQDFVLAGYKERQALEVLVGLACKLLSNYTNALARTPLDEPIKSFAWTHPAER
jgi:alkylhydroperoxidase family enzyme